MGKKKGISVGTLCKIGGALLGVVVVVLLCIYYPTLERYLRGEYMGGVEGTGLPGDATVMVQSSSPYEIQQVGQIGSTLLYPSEEGEFKYTLKKVTRYQDAEEAGLDPKEMEETSLRKGREAQYSFLLLDLSVENVNASPAPADDMNYPHFLALWPEYRNQPGKPAMHLGAEISYFSLHPPITEASKNYYFFALEQGETKEFQIGIYAPTQSIDEQTLFLYLGPMDLGLTFSLFEDAETAPAKE